MKTIETYCGVGPMGIARAFLTKKMKEQAATGLVQDATNPTNGEHLAAIKLCCDKFLGTLMLNGTNEE